MKKSNQVSVSVIVALAAGLTTGGCNSRSSSECEDAQGYAVPDSDCLNGVYGAHWVQTGGFGGSGGYGGYYGG